MQTIITTTLSALTGLVIGFLINKLKEYYNKIENNKKNNNVQNEALRLLLQSNLTNAFFVYDETKRVKDYQYKNWLNMLKIYEVLGGDDYIHELEQRMKTFDIIKTDILK